MCCDIIRRHSEQVSSPSLNFSAIILPAPNAALAIQVEELSQPVLMEIIYSCVSMNMNCGRSYCSEVQRRFDYECLQRLLVQHLAGGA